MINGNALIELGYKPSKWFKEAIAQEAWIESFFKKRNTDITGFKEWFDKKSNC